MNETMTYAAVPIVRRTNVTHPRSMPLDAVALPLVGLAATAATYRMLPAWGAMCLWALAIFCGLKWFTFRTATKQTAPKLPAAASLRQTLGYLFAWPGLDAATFFSNHNPQSRPTFADGARTLVVTAVGATALLIAMRLVTTTSPSVGPLAIGWLGMVGAILTLHFGTFRLTALAWQTAGVRAEPIMDRPLAAATLAEFWDRRWNKAFRDVAHRALFEPLVRHVGPRWALVGVFAASGLVHDVVISLPARAGLGLPTLYFLLQAGAILFTRTKLGLRWGVRRGLGARAFAACVLITPLGLLFHAPFVRIVVVPMFEALSIFR